MKPHIISTTHPVDDEGRPLLAPEEQPTARERIELPPIRVEPFDPWLNAINPEVLTEAGRSAMPEGELPPWGWHKLRAATRAYLGWLAIALLHEHPAPANEYAPARLQRLMAVYDRVGLALRGAYDPCHGRPARSAGACTASWALEARRRRDRRAQPLGATRTRLSRGGRYVGMGRPGCRRPCRRCSSTRSLRSHARRARPRARAHSTSATP